MGWVWLTDGDRAASYRVAFLYTPSTEQRHVPVCLMSLRLPPRGLLVSNKNRTLGAFQFGKKNTTLGHARARVRADALPDHVTVDRTTIERLVAAHGHCGARRGNESYDRAEAFGPGTLTRQARRHGGYSDCRGARRTHVP